MFLLFAGVIVAVVLIAASYFIVIYNGLVSLKHNVEKAWANIDVLLKQRHDELPKLVEVCKQYAAHESGVFDRAMAARSTLNQARESGDVAAVGRAEAQLRTGMGGLFALAEAYPELKANQNFQALQSRITQLENDIADRREFYNESVNLNNVRLEQFPDVVAARLFRFKSFDLLRYSGEETRDVDVKSLFA